MRKLLLWGLAALAACLLFPIAAEASLVTPAYAAILPPRDATGSLLGALGFVAGLGIVLTVVWAYARAATAIAGIAAAVLMVFCLPAIAQGAGSTVTIPWGDWLAAISSNAGLILAALITWGLRQLPQQAVDFIKVLRADQLVNKAIDYGLNGISGAVRGKELSFDVGSAVLAEAIAYAIAQGPAWLINWVGGEAGIRRMIIARLNLEEGVALS